VQSVVDAKNYLPIDYKVTNENDSKAMGGMLRRAKVILNTHDFTALYDKGYHTGSEIKTAQDLGIHLMVAIPDVASHAPDENYDLAKFVYDVTMDTYTCPQNQVLTTNGSWYIKNRGKSFTQMKHYKTKACNVCPAKDVCTKNKDGRLIERSEHALYVEQNRVNIEANTATYKRRQAIVEHPYGIIKRQWGFYYIMTKKGKKRASADVGFMFIAYNLRRIMNILGGDVLKKFLRELALVFFSIIASAKAINFKIRHPIFEEYFSMQLLKPA
jgi:hypothetical protein